MDDRRQNIQGEQPAGDGAVFMVEFKGSRKEYYRNPYELKMESGSWVIVQVERGEDLGRFIAAVEDGRVAKDSIKPLPLLRLAVESEMAIREENQVKEQNARLECLKLIAKRGLKMKLVDVEWQFDGNKITFYFTAEKRVDFRELVKDLAAIFRTRIELRQIGARDEARRVGGMGVCGLEQCCNSFLHEFEPITTQLAREQSLSLNPAKISGNCGRLLCCLRYESEFYRELVKDFPKVGSTYSADEMEGRVERIMILRDQMLLRNEAGEEKKISSTEIRRATRKRPWMKS
ncbi:stage 0 sporulation family protein [Candidatus Zixiibacteriota bacterium]